MVALASSVPPVSRLLELCDALAKEVASETEFRFVNTRVILRTGVNLQSANAEVDPKRLKNVESMLRLMGYLTEYGG